MVVVKWIERPTRVHAIQVRFHLVRKRKIYKKRGRGWPIKKINLDFIIYQLSCFSVGSFLLSYMFLDGPERLVKTLVSS